MKLKSLILIFWNIFLLNIIDWLKMKEKIMFESVWTKILNNKFCKMNHYNPMHASAFPQRDLKNAGILSMSKNFSSLTSYFFHNGSKLSFMY